MTMTDDELIRFGFYTDTEYAKVEQWAKRCPQQNLQAPLALLRQSDSITILRVPPGVPVKKGVPVAQLRHHVPYRTWTLWSPSDRKGEWRLYGGFGLTRHLGRLLKIITVNSDGMFFG